MRRFRRRLFQMAELGFELEYDGPALSEHEMDARDFARSVLSAADVFQEMNRVVNPALPEVSVNIRATSAGSFRVLLQLLTDTEGILTTSAVVASNNLAGLLNIFGGIIRLVRSRGKATTVSQEEISPGQIRVTFDDNQSIEIPSQALGLAESVSIRRSISEIVRPLDAEGIESLTIRQDETVIERIAKSDALALERIPTTVLATISEQLAPTDRATWLVVALVNFKGNGRWKFSEGTDETPFGAKVSDAAFLARVDNGEPFRKNDRMRVVLRETQRVDKQGRLRIEREVVQVLEHAPTGSQPPFDGIG
jgi:hypothetical protein